MKKRTVFIAIAALFGVFFCACGKGRGGNAKASAPERSPGVQKNTEEAGNAGGNGELRLLSNPYGESACSTEDGYYYLTEGTTELRDGSYGSRLMHMDFASGREICLCSTAGCSHDSADCPAVFLYDDFPPASTLLFVFQEHLYILSREYDQDGALSEGTVQIGGGELPEESSPAVLYRASLDGTGREKVYAFDPALTVEDKLAGDEQGIYAITKKLSADKDGSRTYTTSSERKLMFLDLASLSLKEVCSMDFGDSVSWQLFGCLENDFVLRGTDFGREISREEQWDDEAYKGLYENSSEVYALLSRDGGAPREIERKSNRQESSAKLLGGCLYVSSRENQDIEVLNLKTGEKDTLCSLPQNQIMDVLGDRLCCRDWDLSGDPVWYFADTKTGEITRTPLVNRRNGWSLEFRAETAEDVLFICDYDADENSDGSYTIRQYKYALMAKEELFAGKENYREIEMTSPGQ